MVRLLQRLDKTYAIGPLVSSTKHTSDNSNANQLAQSPAEVDISSKIPSQCHWAHLTCVSNGKSLEYTPWDTAEDFRDLEMNDILCGEEDSCEANDESEAGHDGVTITEALRDETINEETNDFSYIGTLESLC
jgi:hypothetical protein